MVSNRETAPQRNPTLEDLNFLRKKNVTRYRAGMDVTLKPGDTIQARINGRLRLCEVVAVEPPQVKVSLLDTNWESLRVIEQRQVMTVINR
jgi:hypothetical protein